MSDAGDIAVMIDRLVVVHGEEGICPTAADWRAIFDLGAAGPVHILNLLKFRPQVETPTGPVSGTVAYGKYASGMAQAFIRVGGERIFFGHVGHMFAFGNVDLWDATIVTRYPSAAALAEMWLDPHFIAAHANRVDGVERSQVMVFGG